MQRAKPFQDRSVLQVEGSGAIFNLKQMQNNLSAMIEEQINLGSELFFPSSDQEINTVAVLIRHDASDKNFKIFDVRRNSFIRKVQKQSQEDEAFALDASGRFLIYAEGD